MRAYGRITTQHFARSNNMKKFEKILGEWVLKHRWAILLSTLIVFVIAASGMRFLTFSNQPATF